MKIQTTTLDIERSGLQTESQFTIKATAKAFDILSSSLYSDKILAVVRELSCNAYDSHVAAGKADVPFEIRLPTSLDAMFHVRDFGVGLSDFQIRGSWSHENGSEISIEEGAEANLIDEVDGWTYNSGIYTTYFDSSKTNSDDFIGQLGLGSKSPFSYATTFIVESIHNGVKRVYTCFKNEHNMPSVARLGEEPSEECNGVMVSMAVRGTDVDKFHSAARKALMYFKPQPTVVGRTGFTPFSLKHTVTGNKWRIRDAEYYAHMSGAHVVQGFVAYPIDAHILNEHGLSGTAQALAGVDVDMYVDIGAVETAASREALSYVPHTISNLIAAFEQAATEMRVAFQAEFDKCTTVWEMAMLLSKMEGGDGSSKFGKIFKDMNRLQPFQWNGADVTATVNLKLSKIRCTQIQRLSIARVKKAHKVSNKGQWTPQTHAQEFEFDIDSKLVVMIGDDGRGSSKEIKQFLIDRPNTTMLLIRPIVGRAMYDQGEINAILAMLGNPPTLKLSDLPPMSTTAARRQYGSSGAKRSAELKLVFTEFPVKRNHWGEESTRRVFSRLTWEATEIDMTAGGFYVELYKFSPISVNGVNVLHLDEIIESAKMLGLLEEDDKVVGFSETELFKAKKQSSKWVNLFDHLRAGFNEANEDDAMFSGVVADEVFSLIGTNVRSALIKRWDALEQSVNEGPFKTTVSALAQLDVNAGVYESQAVNLLALHLGIKRGDDTRVSTMPREWATMLQKYELLTMIPMNVGSNWVQPVIRYVNLVDAPTV